MEGGFIRYVKQKGSIQPTYSWEQLHFDNTFLKELSFVNICTFYACASILKRFLGQLNMTQNTQTTLSGHFTWPLDFKQSVDRFLFKIAWLHPENYRKRTPLVYDCYHVEISTSHRTCEEGNSANFVGEFSKQHGLPNFNLDSYPTPKGRWTYKSQTMLLPFDWSVAHQSNQEQRTCPSRD